MYSHRRHHGESRSKHHKRRHRHSSTNHCPVAPACLVSAKLDSVGITTFKESSVKVSHGDSPARECEDRRNYYLDLAGVENTCSRLHNNFTSCSAPKPGFLSSLMGVGSHHRSRSYDITKCVDCSKEDTKHEAIASCRCDNAKDLGKGKLRTKCNKLKLEHQHLRSKSSDSHEAGHRSSGTKHASGLHTHSGAGGGIHSHSNRHSSYVMSGGFDIGQLGQHHRRHRHKEKDQEMAMQQVAQWIEREHLWDLTGENQLPVQRHEHHHVHEHHHHHHYHHYYET